MRNKAADRLVLTGVILHIIQWFSVLWAFLKIENSFGHFTIYNPKSSTVRCSLFHLCR